MSPGEPLQQRDPAGSGRPAGDHQGVVDPPPDPPPERGWNRNQDRIGRFEARLPHRRSQLLAQDPTDLVPQPPPAGELDLLHDLLEQTRVFTEPDQPLPRKPPAAAGWATRPIRLVRPDRAAAAGAITRRIIRRPPGRGNAVRERRGREAQPDALDLQKGLSPARARRGRGRRLSPDGTPTRGRAGAWRHGRPGGGPVARIAAPNRNGLGPVQRLGRPDEPPLGGALGTQV
jgi:hypothetical protein